MKEYFFYTIGDFEVYPNSFEIRKGQERIRIQRKAMQVLLVLIENSQKVVTKEELAREVWGKTIVSENSLMKIISELRKILSDSKNAPEYIETIPKIGYCFLKTPIKSAFAFGPKKNRRFLFGLLFIFLAIFVSLILLLNNDQDYSKKSIISPNGKFILKTNKEGDSLSILIKDIQKVSIERLIKIQFPESIAIQWSPDNERIIFNATLTSDDFFTVCVYTMELDHYTYVRFGKPGHNLEAATAHIDSLKEIVPHTEITSGEVRVEFLQIEEEDTVKMLMEGMDIVGFEW